MSDKPEFERVLIPAWNAFTASPPMIPELYWNVKSSEQRWKNICCDLKKVIEYASDIGEQVNVNTEDIEEIEQIISDISKGKYVDKYIDSLAQYIDDNLIAFVARLAKYVFPGLYWDGECYRYQIVIPHTWDWLKFRWVFSDDDDCYYLSLTY